jgi:hypothetical protein
MRPRPPAVARRRAVNEGAPRLALPPAGRARAPRREVAHPRARSPWRLGGRGRGRLRRGAGGGRRPDRRQLAPGGQQLHLLAVQRLALEQRERDRLQQLAVLLEDLRACSYASSRMRLTSASTSCAVCSLTCRRCPMSRPRKTSCSESPIAIGPIASLIPNCVTIRRAICVARSMSLPAPVVTFSGRRSSPRRRGRRRASPAGRSGSRGCTSAGPPPAARR